MLAELLFIPKPYLANKNFDLKNRLQGLSRLRSDGSHKNLAHSDGFCCNLVVLVGCRLENWGRQLDDLGLPHLLLSLQP